MGHPFQVPFYIFSVLGLSYIFLLLLSDNLMSLEPHPAGLDTPESICAINTPSVFVFLHVYLG